MVSGEDWYDQGDSPNHRLVADISEVLVLIDDSTHSVCYSGQFVCVWLVRDSRHNGKLKVGISSEQGPSWCEKKCCSAML